MRPVRPPGIERSVAKLSGRARNLERRGPSPWHNVGDTGEPTFENGWTNVGGAQTVMRFRLTLGAGLEIQGAVTGGSAPLVFTLPSGYRPDHELHLAASDELGGFVVLKIEASGDVSRGLA